MNQPDLFAQPSRSRKDHGIARSAKSAGQEWTSRATYYLRMYLQPAREPFLAEKFVEWAEGWGLEKPPSRRAYGSVMQTAARQGLIRACGYGKAETSNGSPKILWTRV